MKVEIDQILSPRLSHSLRDCGDSLNGLRLSFILPGGMGAQNRLSYKKKILVHLNL